MSMEYLSVSFIGKYVSFLVCFLIEWRVLEVQTS